MEPEEPFAGWVRELRRRLGLTQGELGKRVGVGQGTVSGWERGKTMPPVATQERLTGLAAGAGLGPPGRVRRPDGQERALDRKPTPERVAAREALARLRDRRRVLAAAKKAALAEVRALRVRHRPGTGAGVYPRNSAPQREAFAAALAADHARLAAELAPLEARLAEIGREQEAVEAAVAELRRGGG